MSNGADQGLRIRRLSMLDRAVEPLLVFSHAYLAGRTELRRNGVTILPARMLARYLANRPQRITASDVCRRVRMLGPRPRIRVGGT